MILPVCPYCMNLSTLVTGDIIYPHRLDLHGKYFYICTPCNAYVGCHPGTKKPLGRLANAELRKAKLQAHNAFDILWKSGKMKRRTAYGWLALKLGIKEEDCHIGMFDVEMCLQTVKYCKEFKDIPQSS